MWPIENSLIFNHCPRVDSIGSWSIKSVLFKFRSIEAIFRPIDNLSCFKGNSLSSSISTRLIEFRKERKIKRFYITCSSKVQKNFFSFRPFLSRPIQSKNFFSFSSSNLQGFLSSSVGKTYIHFLFQFVYNSHAFFMKSFQNVEQRGFWDFGFLGCFCSKLIIGFLFLDDIYMIPMH